ncbi:MAG: ABC transporter permease [Myxococcota bacterium]
MDLFREVAESIVRRPLRTATTAFGVFWGMLLLVIMLGAAAGLQNGIAKLFRDDASTSVWISAGSTSLSTGGLPAGRNIRLTVDDAEALRTLLPELSDVSPRHPVDGVVRAPATGRVAGLPVFGIEPGYASVERTQRELGRLLNELDSARARRVAIVGERAAEILFGRPEAALNESIDLQGYRFRVVGVFRDAGGDGEMRRIFVPYAALARTIDGRREAARLVAIADPTVDPALVRRRIRRLVAHRHRFDVADPTAVNVFMALEQYEKFTSLITGLNVMVLLIGLGTLLTAMSGVSNILLVSVRERMREFGLRRALGASAGHIFRMVILEAVGLSALAGSLGVIVGLSVLKGLRDAGVKADYFENPAVEPSTLWPLLGLLVFSAVFAGIVPARQAARVTPAEALRDE